MIGNPIEMALIDFTTHRIPRQIIWIKVKMCTRYSWTCRR